MFVLKMPSNPNQPPSIVMWQTGLSVGDDPGRIPDGHGSA